ncbi:MAG: pentapeptide repeat-containing protein, partial [Cyanobacteria bacterium P01_D01_bin.71]
MNMNTFLLGMLAAVVTAPIAIYAISLRRDLASQGPAAPAAVQTAEPLPSEPSEPEPPAMVKSPEALQAEDACIGCQLPNASLEARDLSRINLSQSDLSNATLSDSQLVNAIFQQAQLTAAQLVNINGSGADFRAAN